MAIISPCLVGEEDIFEKQGLIKNTNNYLMIIIPELHVVCHALRLAYLQVSHILQQQQQLHHAGVGEINKNFA